MNAILFLPTNRDAFHRSRRLFRLSIIINYNDISFSDHSFLT